jgi:hypothetical protein
MFLVSNWHVADKKSGGFKYYDVPITSLNVMLEENGGHPRVGNY